MGPILNAVAAYATLPPAIIEVGAIRLNVESKTVEVNGQRVHLTSMEYELLERLALGKGMTLTKEMILNHLYGGIRQSKAISRAVRKGAAG
jgi:DNA-binding response OmpR family regulator